METWALEHYWLTFILAFPALFVVRSMFVALGGGYQPRKYCEHCSPERDDEDENDERD